MSTTIHLQRVLKAPPSHVYRALLDPDAMVRWSPPYGFLGKVFEHEAKVGGGYRMAFINFRTGTTHSFSGTYTKLVENERICYTDAFDDPDVPEMNMTMTLKPVSCGTELHIEHAGIPDSIPSDMCYLGWQESLDQLAHLVEPEIPDDG